MISICRLVCGDVHGRFAQLFARVSNIQKKAGQFDVILSLLSANFYVIVAELLDRLKKNKQIALLCNIID